MFNITFSFTVFTIFALKIFITIFNNMWKLMFVFDFIIVLHFSSIKLKTIIFVNSYQFYEVKKCAVQLWLHFYKQNKSGTTFLIIFCQFLAFIWCRNLVLEIYKISICLKIIWLWGVEVSTDKFYESSLTVPIVIQSDEIYIYIFTMLMRFERSGDSARQLNVQMFVRSTLKKMIKVTRKKPYV